MIPLIQERFGEDPGALISYVTVWQVQKKYPRGVKVQFTKDSRTSGTTVVDYVAPRTPRRHVACFYFIFITFSHARLTANQREDRNVIDVLLQQACPRLISR